MIYRDLKHNGESWPELENKLQLHGLSKASSYLYFDATINTMAGNSPVCDLFRCLLDGFASPLLALKLDSSDAAL